MNEKPDIHITLVDPIRSLKRSVILSRFWAKDLRRMYEA